MVAVVDTVRRLLAEQGRTQVCVIQKMNRCDPEINIILYGGIHRGNDSKIWSEGLLNRQETG